MGNRYAVYSKEIGYPLIFNTREQATKSALALRGVFSDVTLRPVYPYKDTREGRMYSNTRASGYGGIFRDQYGSEIVLGEALLL